MMQQKKIPDHKSTFKPSKFAEIAHNLCALCNLVCKYVHTYTDDSSTLIFSLVSRAEAARPGPHSAQTADSPSGHVGRVVALGGGVVEDSAVGAAAQLGVDAVQAHVEEAAVGGVVVGRVDGTVAQGVQRVSGVRRTGEVALLCSRRGRVSGVTMAAWQGFVIMLVERWYIYPCFGVGSKTIMQ